LSPRFRKPAAATVTALVEEAMTERSMANEASRINNVGESPK
jgi:hypothetical protein